MKIVNVVHCIDTEGPLHEKIGATFDRLFHSYGIRMHPSKTLLTKIQKKKINLNGLENEIAEAFSKKFLNYNNNWNKIEKMYSNFCLNRKKFKDSFGNFWKINFFCLDNVFYTLNPRQREMGFHKIYDKYKFFISKYKSRARDKIYFHFHPHSFDNNATSCGTRWIMGTDKLTQILSRKIIQRNWFPSVNRPGFQVNRPDSHWFLEQFIPFDYSNLSYRETKKEKIQRDFSGGRSGDWRRAPLTWEPYHPSHDDYQKRGECKRLIIRCLNIGTRSYLLNQKEVDRAFIEAQSNKKVILSFANHDYRNINYDIIDVYKMLLSSAKKFKNIKFKFCSALEAAQNFKKKKLLKKFDVKIKLYKTLKRLEIKSNQNIFGSQPYLALETKKNQFLYDNLDFQVPKRSWSYTFDKDTIMLDQIKKIGVAVNNEYGQTVINVVDVKNNKTIKTYLND